MGFNIFTMASTMLVGILVAIIIGKLYELTVLLQRRDLEDNVDSDREMAEMNGKGDSVLAVVHLVPEILVTLPQD